MRGSCLAIRSALTDDGRPPLAAAGIQPRGRLEAIAPSRDRVTQCASQSAPEDQRTRGRTGTGGNQLLVRLPRLVRAGLETTTPLWPPIQVADAYLHRAAHLLANAGALDRPTVQERYAELAAELPAAQDHQDHLDHLDHLDPGRPRRPPAAHFLKVTASYWPGLLACYDVAALPRTNNGLEQ